MITRSGNILPSSYQELDQLFRRFFGDPARHGWRVRMRHRFGYAPGDYWYQAVVDRLVNDGCNWIDVGGGKSIMPFNEPLAAELASRCNLLVGVDPSENLNQNPYVGQRFVGMIEDYRSEPVFDLVTMRMVVEHIEKPHVVAASLESLIKPGGYVVIYTPNRWSPASTVASLVPNKWHQHVTRILWRTNDEDVFPTQYRMNTRKRLRNIFEKHGFAESAFAYVDDLSSLKRFRLTLIIELCAWRILNGLGITYPENQLLGIYQKLD